MKVCVLFGSDTLPHVPFPELKTHPVACRAPWTLWPCSPAIDGDFQPQEEEEDDEETIEVEEQQEGNDAETQRREIELLRREGELPLEELLRSLPPQLLEGPSSPLRTPSSHDSDARDVPEEGGEEDSSQVLKVWAEEVEGRLKLKIGPEGRDLRTELFPIISVVIIEL